MLKLNASYSKKVPVQGQEFSSQSYHCSVELELSDNLTPEDLRGQIHNTFSLVKQSVEAELTGKGNGTSAPPANANGNGARTHTNSNNGNGAKASNKQVKYILDLAKQQGLGLSDVNAQAQNEYGVGSVYALDRKSASAMVDRFKAAA